MDPEVLRQRAAARRKLKEADEAACAQAAVEARKAAEEQVKAEAKVKSQEKPKEGTKRPSACTRRHRATPAEIDENRKPRSSLARNAPAGVASSAATTCHWQTWIQNPE